MKLKEWKKVKIKKLINLLKMINKKLKKLISKIKDLKSHIKKIL